METIRICKDRNILKQYLESKEKEVVSIMMTLFDDDYILEAYAKELNDNAIHKADRETATRMIMDGVLSLETIARYVPSLSMAELQALEADILQLV